MKAAFQCAASFHWLVEAWKDCEELKPKPKERWIFVDKKKEEKEHRTEWYTEAVYEMSLTHNITTSRHYDNTTPRHHCTTSTIAPLHHCTTSTTHDTIRQTRQHTTTHYSTLQHTATHHNMLQHTTTHSSYTHKRTDTPTRRSLEAENKELKECEEGRVSLLEKEGIRKMFGKSLWKSRMRLRASEN